MYKFSIHINDAVFGRTTNYSKAWEIFRNLVAISTEFDESAAYICICDYQTGEVIADNIDG